MTTGTVLRKSVTIDRPVGDAFGLFTEGIATWWPLRTHSVAKEDAETAVFEAGVGGRIYERTTDGEEHLWGTVLVWEPPARIVYAWHPGRGDDTAQEIEIRFLPDGDRTRIELEHGGWERLGARAPETIRNYDTGWDYVLGGCYVEATTGARSGT